MASELLKEELSNYVEPTPNQVDESTGKKMWIIDEYKIWAFTYIEALELLSMIQSF